MSSLNVQVEKPRAQHVAITNDSLVVELTDGRTISTPLAWYPRLQHADPKERDNWRLIGNGGGIHWPDLDEDLSVDGLILGRPSGESPTSLKRWLEGRRGLKKRARSSTGMRDRKVASAASRTARAR